MTADEKWPKPGWNSEAEVLRVLQMAIPGLTLEEFREGAKRHQEKERIRSREEAARRKAKRDAKKEQGA
jgi:hypothetical protein